MARYVAPFRNERTGEEVRIIVEADHEDHAIEQLPERLAGAGLPQAVEVDGTVYDPWGLLPLRLAAEGEEEHLPPRDAAAEAAALEEAKAHMEELRRQLFT